MRKRRRSAWWHLSIVVSAAIAAQTAIWAQGTVSSLNPSSAPVRTAAGAAVPVTMAGSNLSNTTTVQWLAPNGFKTTIPAALIQAAEVTATIPAALLTTPGTAQMGVIDSAGLVSNQLPFTIMAGPTPLMITNGGNQGAVLAGGTLTTTFNASGGTPPYKWSATGLSSAFTLDPSTGQVSGVARLAPGSFSFTIQVTDSGSPPGTATAAASFSVLGFTTPATLPNAATSTPYATFIAATGGMPPYTFTASNLPDGLSFSTAGFLSGTASAAGTDTISVTLRDVTGLSTTSSFTLTVNSGVEPLQVTGSALPDAMLGAAYSQALEATGGAPPYTWSFASGTLPAGISLSSAGTVFGTPSAPGGGAFRARVTDSAGAVQVASFSLAVKPAPLTVTVTPLPAALATAAYPEQVIAASGGVPPYTLFALTAGSLPDGLAFTDGGISGTPNTAGDSAFTVTVTDSAGTTASGGFNLVVRPFAADLVVSQASESFALAAGTLGLPAAYNVAVRSSLTTQILNYTAAVSAPAPWLDVTTGSGTTQATTPGVVTLALDPSALALPIGNFQTSVIVTCAAPSPCAGNSQVIAVSLTISAPSPELAVGAAQLSFAATGSNPPAMSQPLGLQNTGGGSIAVNSVTAADSWIAISGVPATLSPGPATLVTVTVNPAGLAPGYHQSSITVTTSAGSASIPVSLFISASPQMILNPEGSQILSGGGPQNSSGSFQISVTGTASVNWSAAVEPGSPWLSVSTPSGTATAASPGVVNFSVDKTQLGSGQFYGTIRVTSSGVANPILDYLVVVDDTLVFSRLAPRLSPLGLLFLGAGGAATPPQTVQILGRMDSPVPYQVSSDSSFVSVSPSTGTVSASSPATSTISVNTTGLGPGPHLAQVTYAYSSGASATLNVVVLVPRAATGNSLTPVFSASLPGCTPTQLVPLQTGLINNFSQPTSWPTPLLIKLVDDCGSAVPNGQIVATFSNGDAPLVLQATDTASGIYSGTWTPRAASPQVTINARATAPSLATGTLVLTGQVTHNAAPVLTPGGTLNVFGAPGGSPLAPGEIIQIYGSNLAAQPTPFATVPLTTSLGNTQVLIGGISAPLYYVSPGQINAEVPFELKAGAPYQLIVDANGALSSPLTVQVAADGPGIAAFADGTAIAQHADGSLVTDSAPAAPGEYVVFYLAGMGQTSATVASGQASPFPAGVALDVPVLLLNGQAVPIYFAGLSPTYVALYQLNFQIPPGTPNGDLQLVVTQSGGQTSTTVLAVHN